VLLMSSVLTAAEVLPGTFVVQPPEVQLSGGRATQQLLVSGQFANDLLADVSVQARYESLSPDVVEVTPQGLLLPRSHGETQIVVRHAGQERRVSVTVGGLADADPIDFRTDVMAAFSRAGCNQGSCHGSPQGKNGFRLSLRGFDPDVDFFTLTHQDGGRRTNVLQPEASLILLKGTGSVPHQGGTRFKVGEAAHRTLLAWIGEGCRDSAKPRKLVQLEVLPGDRRLHTDFPRQQLVGPLRRRSGARRDGLVRLHHIAQRGGRGLARRTGRVPCHG
jgi:hypothetical protein